MIYKLDHRVVFPPVELAEPSGILAVGGDLRPERLILAYASGIFPWYDEGLPILWHSPDPRFVLETSALHVPRSLEKELRRGTYEVRSDENFARVIEHCGRVKRPYQRGTWITKEMIGAYSALFELGLAHSVEAYLEGTLVGGLYGVCLGSVFFGESMFSLAPDASKVAFVTAVRQFEGWGIDLVDCQVHTDHLERFGAVHWPRATYIRALEEKLARPTRQGRWALGQVHP